MEYTNIQAQLHEIINQYPDENSRRPILDGLTYPEKYSEARVKIMFVLKEAYDVDKETKEIGSGGWDHTKLLNTDDYSVIKGNKTHRRVSEVATALLRNVQYEDSQRELITEDEKLDDFKKIAWINVGKYPAPEGSKTIDRRLKDAYKCWKSVLFQQIESYNPSIIIFGGTFSLFHDDIQKQIGNCNFKGPFGKWPAEYWEDTVNNRLLIKTSHPGFRYLRYDKTHSLGSESEKCYIDSILDCVKNSGKY